MISEPLDFAVVDPATGKPTRISISADGSIAPSQAQETDLVSQLAALPLVPRETNLGLAHGENGAGFIQPVKNVLEYLDKRAKRPSWEGEECLLVKLFEDGQEEVKALTRACLFVQSLSTGKNRISVSAACKRALSVYCDNQYIRKLKPGTFRETYDLWAKTQDWVSLVNIAKAPGEWKPENRGLCDAFLEYASQKIAEFARGRGDTKAQAILEIKRIWRTGRNKHGHEETIPSYEKGWANRVREIYPQGWGYENICRQVKERGKITKAVGALMRGTAFAKPFLPRHLRTRKGLRFLEEVTFDDVRTDWLIFDPATGQPCELWLLVARDSATAMVLGFVMHPSRKREDNSDSHLGLKEMKQLAAWLLERYPLPRDYVVHWVVERGTATLSEGSAKALQELLPCCADGTPRIQIHFTSMMGGKSPSGYKEKRKGNSSGKAGHESDNRVFHTAGSYIPGQTGATYDLRPAQLDAMVDECVEIWELREKLPMHLRGQEKYPLFTLVEAREHLVQICIDKNFREDHALEGFGEVLEWFDGQHWRDRSEWDGVSQVKWNRRKERPVERAAVLMRGVQWERVSPDIIIAFLRHTEKTRPIENDGGEIKFKRDDAVLTYRPAQNACVPAPDAKVLCYFNEDDPAFLHVTDGRKKFLGVWYRRNRIPSRDYELLEKAFEYTESVLKAARARAEQLAEPERQRLESIRAHNAELVQRGNEFIDVTRPKLETQNPQPLSSNVATGLAAVATQKRKNKTREQQLQALEGDASDLL